MKNKFKFFIIVFIGIITLVSLIIIFNLTNKKGIDKTKIVLQEGLGSLIFFDTNLSEPKGMSCATCHNPEQHFASNNGGKFGVAIGSRAEVSGMRNTPSAMYASFTPPFHFEKDENGELEPVGGMFWDGRVNTLAEQSKKPFFNVREMNNPNSANLAQKLSQADYADLFRQIGGKNIFDDPEKAVDVAANALQAFENTAIFHPFSSKYDTYIQGRITLTDEEKRGLDLFKNPDKGNCAACHVMNDKSPRGEDSLFTDFTYDNLSVPRNNQITDNRDPHFFDLGLCGPERTAPDGNQSFCGAFKVPSLRNVATRQFYFHNGYFNNLHDAVAFYATRDTNPELWYPNGNKFNDTPLEYRANINTNEVPYNRKKGEQPILTEAEINDIVAFLNTLTD